MTLHFLTNIGWSYTENQFILCDSDFQATTAESEYCCKNHPEKGECIPGKDDRHGSETLPDGYCRIFCIDKLCNGGVCNDNHLCHCVC